MGDTQPLRYVIEDPNGIRTDTYFRALRFPTGYAAMQVRFDPAALPVRCWRFRRDREGAPDVSQEEVTLGPYHAAHMVAMDVTPGVLGLRWDWG